jgi:hypothetical protein
MPYRAPSANCEPPLHIEFFLTFVIARSGIQQPRADRRLNGIENTIVSLARRWRSEQPIEPARELRMSDATRAALLIWIGARSPAPLPSSTGSPPIAAQR